MKEEIILNLYRERLNRYLDQRPMSNNINLKWNELKDGVIKAADKLLGRHKKTYSKSGLQSWNQNVAQLIADKKKAYLQFLQTKTESDQIEYKRIGAIVKRETRGINGNSWDTYCDMHAYLRDQQQINCTELKQFR
jgi:uncharacterized protein YecE (DUF72 family)